ncbi:MAG: biotin/lipoyl-binding protein [Propionibacteriaceae bacterium]|jgi:HlyD family secretion protein|nr:biotin/lipoyl-binding protein [Propionibacteriaceae bacterium]
MNRFKTWVVRSADGFGIKVPVYLTIMSLLIVGAVAGGIALVRNLSYEPPRWVTTTAAFGTVEQVVTIQGTVEKSNQASLSFPIDAEVLEVYVALGDEVSPGQPIARIDDTGLWQALDSAQATYDRARYSLSQLEAARNMSDALTGAGGGQGGETMDLTQALQQMQQLAASMQQAQQTAGTAYQRLTTECGWLGEQLPSEMPTELPTTWPSWSPTAPPTSAPTSPDPSPSGSPDSSPSAPTTSWPTSWPTELPSTLPPDFIGDSQTCLQALQDLAGAGMDLVGAQLEAMTLMGSVMEGMQGSLAGALGGISVNEVTLAAARAAMSSAERTLLQARLDLDSAVIRAPIAGVLAKMPYAVGEQEHASQEAVIIGPGTVTVTLAVPLAQIPLIQPGQQAIISQVGTSEVTGVVTSKALLPATAESTDYQVVVSSSGAANALRAGARATVQIKVAVSENAVTVPVSAVHLSGEGDAAEILVLAGTDAEVRQVTYATIGGGRVAITSGLQSGETVILADSHKPLPDLLEEIQQMMRSSRR